MVRCKASASDRKSTPAWRIRLIVLLALLASVGGVARAEDSAVSDETAQAWFERALSLSREQNWPEARTAYLRSLAREPRVSTYFNLAVVSLKLRLGRDALVALDDFARAANPRVHAEYLAESATLRARALDLVGTVELAVEPSEASVRVDDEERPLPPSPVHRIQLDPGHHSLSVSAAGWHERTQELEVAAGDVLHESVALVPEVTPDREPSAPVLRSPLFPAETQRKRDPARRNRILFWGGLSILAAGAIAAVTIVTLVRRGEDAPHGSGGSSGILF